MLLVVFAFVLDREEEVAGVCVGEGGGGVCAAPAKAGHNLLSVRGSLFKQILPAPPRLALSSFCVPGRLRRRADLRHSGEHWRSLQNVWHNKQAHGRAAQEHMFHLRHLAVLRRVCDVRERDVHGGFGGLERAAVQFAAFQLHRHVVRLRLVQELDGDPGELSAW